MSIEFPVLKGTVEDVVKSLVGWMDKAIQRRQWTDSEIDEKFANRTVEQILAEGHTCYMNPCFDFVEVALLALNANGYETNLFVEELKHEGYDHTRLHFVVEFNACGKDYFIDFKSMNKVVWGEKEKRTLRPDVKQINALRFPGNRFGIDAPFYIGVGADSREDVDTLFFDYKFAPQLERLKHDNTPETFKKYLEHISRNENLFVVREDADF